MIRFLKHNEIIKSRWDDCLQKCHNRMPYAQAWYLDIVSPGWNALVEGDYESIMPLTGKKKYGISYLYPPYFAQQLGVFSKNSPDAGKIREFLDAIPDEYKFIEILMNTQNPVLHIGYQTKKNTNLELSLRPDYATLRRNYSYDIIRNIRKSERSAPELRINTDPKEIIRIFRKNTGRKITNLTTKNYSILLELLEEALERKSAETWGLYLDGKLCAGVVWLLYSGRAVFLFSATDPVAKRTGAMHSMIDRFIRDHAGQDLILDFEGSNLPGLARFYKGFGSKETVYLQVRKNKLPRLVRWIKG